MQIARVACKTQLLFHGHAHVRKSRHNFTIMAGAENEAAGTWADIGDGDANLKGETWRAVCLGRM